MRYADHFRPEEIFPSNQHFYRYKLPCFTCGSKHTIDIPGPALFAYRQGKHIQNAMPMLSDDEREILLSGICAKCFGEEPEE